ncbi:MAG: biopolymer transporter ExbD [bacterium]
MKAPSRASGKHRIMADINMIPFIDVSLVLLLIFMIMTPLMVRSQLKINLPSTKDSQQDITRKETIQVQVDRTGTAYLSGMPVAPDLLESRLRQLLKDPNQPVVVEADKDVPFQFVITVMDAAKRIGALKLAVCVKKQGKK